jgi:hypothetical protein
MKSPVPEPVGVADGAPAAPGRGWRAAVAYCGRREHLRRTLWIALVVGIVLTSINQLDVILRGDATGITWVKCGMNFAVPFIVSNLGLLSGRGAYPAA